MPGTSRFFVTEQGIIAALTDQKVLALLRSAVIKHRVVPVRRAVQRGWLAPARHRPARPSLRTLVCYVATSRVPGHLGPSLHRVYRMLHLHPKGLTTPELVTRLSTMEPNTLRWAVQILRQGGFVRTVTASSMPTSH